MVATVARDASGVILCSPTRSFPYIDSILHAKLHAILVGAELALFKGLHNVVIESDLAMAIGELSKGLHSTCIWAGLVCDIVSISYRE